VQIGADRLKVSEDAVGDAEVMLRPKSRVHRWWLDLALWRKGLIALSLPLVALWPTLAGGAYALVQQEDVRQQGRDASDAIDDASNVLQLVTDAETGVRGFAATGEASFLDPYQLAVSELPGALDTLEAGLPADHQDTVVALRSLVGEDLLLLARLQQAVATGADPATVLNVLQQGRVTTDQIRRSVGQLEEDLEGSVAERRGEVDDLGTLVLWLLLGGIVLGGVAGLAAMALFANGVSRRIALLHENVERFMEGEPAIPGFVGEDEIGRFTMDLSAVGEVIVDRDEQLRETRDEAVRATQAKDEFLSRMSHELRTPLTAIIGFGQLLQLEDLNPDDQESVDHIVKAGRHLLALINEVLDIAKIETGHLSLSVEPIDLDELLAETTALMGPVAAEAGISFLPAAVTGAGVVADHQRLKQVLLNLLSNAIKYNRPEGLVTLLVQPRGSSIVRISVADTGHGIPEEDRDRVFAAFDRLEAEHTEVEGTGVGLSLSKGLVDAMGGTLDFESAVGSGSTFWVDLPRAEVLERDLTPSWADQLQPLHPDHAGRQQPVLAIEDNDANIRVLQRVFAKRGEALEFAGQGRQGIELARQIRPRLILLDLHLPDLDGAEVLQRLKSDPETSTIPVVIVSADLSPGRRERLLRLGAHDLLPKPLDLGRLLALLDDTPALPAAAEPS
jgi:signal transduction histidine kinase/ActR/RegA family two-component response regulator